MAEKPITEGTEEKDSLPLWSAAYLRGFRLARGWSVERLSSISGVARDSIARIESGVIADEEVRPATVVRLARALGVDPWRLWVLPEPLRADLARAPVLADEEEPPPLPRRRKTTAKQPEQTAEQPPEEPEPEELSEQEELGARVLEAVPPRDPGDNVWPAIEGIGAVIAGTGEDVSARDLIVWMEWWIGRIDGLDDMHRQRLRARVRKTIHNELVAGEDLPETTDPEEDGA